MKKSELVNKLIEKESDVLKINESQGFEGFSRLEISEYPSILSFLCNEKGSSFFAYRGNPIKVNKPIKDSEKHERQQGKGRSWIRKLETRHNLIPYHTSLSRSPCTNSRQSFCDIKDSAAFNLEFRREKPIRKHKTKLAYFWKGTYYLYPVTFSKVYLKGKRTSKSTQKDLYELVKDLSNKKVNAKDTFFSF